MVDVEKTTKADKLFREKEVIATKLIDIRETISDP